MRLRQSIVEQSVWRPKVAGFLRTLTPSVFDPGTLTLQGWWRGEDYDFANATCPGRASQGPSGSRPLADTTYGGAYKPNKALAALNGLAVFDLFDTFRWLDAAGPWSNYWTAGQFTIVMLAQLGAVISGGANRSMFAIEGLFGGLVGDTATNEVRGMVYDATAAYNQIGAASNGSAWTAYIAQFNAGQIRFRKNTGAWSANQASGNLIPGTTSRIVLGGANPVFRAAEIITAPNLTDFQLNNICSYFSSRYALSL